MNNLVARTGEIYTDIITNINLLSERRKCFICKRTFFTYLPVFSEDWYLRQLIQYGVNFNFRDMTFNRWEYRCPYCGSIDRTRLIMLYVRRHYRREHNLKVLYFAPAPGGVKFLKERLKYAKVDSNDLYKSGVDYHLDIQNMQEIPDNSYDLVICSHVLEHVADDISALKELYRVTKYGGEVLILVPLDTKRVWFDEANGLSKEMNWKRFGQVDHVRRYTDSELKKRIQNAGFYCELFTGNDVDDKVRSQNAFNKYIRIYIAKKEVEK